MKKHLVYCLFYILWFQSGFTVNSLASDICVFGTESSCFYQCKCQFFNCSIQQDPNCKICQNLTGLCIIDENACKYDTLINEIYVTSYWTGAACQKGNIAAGKLYSISGDLVNINPALREITDGSLTDYAVAYVIPIKHTATFYLEQTHQIEFIDLFLHSDKLPLAALTAILTTRLVMENGSFSECPYVQHPSNDYRLNTTLVGKERMHFICNSRSVGYKLELVMQGTDSGTYLLYIYEIVIIGYKYADVNTQNCLQIEGDEEISWCSKCNNTFPPECRQECPQSFTGINCKDIETTLPTESYDSATNGVIFIAIGIVIGLLLCICCTLVVIVIVYKHRKKKHKTEVNLVKEVETEQTCEEETYEELDDATMDNANGRGQEISTEPTVGFRKSSTPNEYLVITGLDKPRKSIKDDYLSTKSTEDIKTDKKVYGKDTYLTPRGVATPTLY